MDQNQNAEFAAAADATHPDDSGSGAANHAHQTSAPDATTNQDLAPTAAPTANPASSGAETGAAVASSDDGSGDTYPQQSNAVPMPDVPVPIPVTVPVSVPGLLVNAPSPAGQMVSVPVPMDMINVPAPVPVPATVQDPVGAVATDNPIHNPDASNDANNNNAAEEVAVPSPPHNIVEASAVDVDVDGIVNIGSVPMPMPVLDMPPLQATMHHPTATSAATPVKPLPHILDGSSGNHNAITTPTPNANNNNNDNGTPVAPKSSRKQQARMDSIWYKHLQELKAYKEKNGTVSVPRKSGQLGEWCRTQRRYYRMYRRGETVPLTRERMRALEALGFIWFPAEERKKKKREASLKALVKADPSLGIGVDSLLGNGNVVISMSGIDSSSAGGGENMNMDRDSNRMKVQLQMINADNRKDVLEQQERLLKQESSTSAAQIAMTTTTAATTITPSGNDASGTLLADQEVDTKEGIHLRTHDATGEEHANKRQKTEHTKPLNPLEQSHKTYNQSIGELHKANEKLCDARDLLERAMQAHQQALECQRDATTRVNKACDEVLERELKDNSDEEWNCFYRRLKAYKEEKGEILFARVVGTGADKKASESANGTKTTKAEEDPVDGVVDTAAIATAEIVNDMVVDVDQATNTGEGGVVAVTGGENKNEGIGKDENESIGKDGALNEEEKYLSEWVSTMRKAPKKSVSEWRHKALDKLGFIWNQYDAIWTARYRELLEYKENYGHTQVPTSFPILGVWVGTQRKQYRLKQRGKYSHMTDERMAMLNSMGFVWEINSWNEKFEELKLFRNQHGHFLVPTEFPNKQLRPWISTQRSHFRFKQEGKASQMTDERVELLNSIGFPWKTKEDWQTRFNELILFFHEHGNLQVPRVYDKAPKLYRWVNCQKMEFQKHLMGHESRLKPEQIKMLDNLGFEQVVV